jgi:hypothetical protein
LRDRSCADREFAAFDLLYRLDGVVHEVGTTC